MMKNIALSFLTLLSTAQASCRLNDITNIIGGDSYSVDHITAATSGNTIVIAGRFTDNKLSKGFVYQYNLDTCFADPKQIMEIPALSQGVVNAQITYQTVYLLGYNRDNQDQDHETVVVFNLHNMDATLETLSSPDDYPIPQSETGFFLGTFITSDLEEGVIVVSSSQIRVYLSSDISLQVYNLASSTVAAQLSLDYLISVGLSQTDTTIAFYSLYSDFTAPAFAVSFTQDHGGAAQTQLTAFDDLDQLHVLLALSLHQGSQNATILTHLQTDSAFATQKINNYGFAEALKCLYIDTDGSDANLLLVDSQSRVNMITIGLSDGIVTKQQITNSIPFYRSFSTMSPADRVAIVKGWDHYILGVTDFVELQGETFKFKKQIGFVMALQQNRISKILFDAPFTSTTTLTELPFSDVSDDEQLVYTAEPQRMDASSTVYLSKKGNKNDWIKQMEACYILSSEAVLNPEELNDNGIVFSTCHYFELFDNFPLLTSTLEPNISKYQMNCLNSQNFQLSAGIFSKAQQSMRSICFPFYKEQQNEPIPISEESKPMVTVDKENLRLVWNYIDKQLAGNTWIYKMNEFSDDKLIKSNEYAEFWPVRVPNIAFRLQSNQFWSYTLPQSFAVSGTFSADMNCWSQVCPDYIKYDAANYTFYSDFSSTNQRVLNATFVYIVLYSYEDFQKAGHEDIITIMLNVTAVSSKVGINITLPFDQWYELNRNKVPYYSPPTLSTNLSDDLNPLLKQTNLIEDFKKSMSTEQKSATSKWTTEQFQRAYKEALERVSKPVVPIRVTTNFDEFGLLTLQFSNPVSFPSYLIEEATREIEAQKGGKRQLEVADVFYSSSDFVQIEKDQKGLPEESDQWLDDLLAILNQNQSQLTTTPSELSENQDSDTNQEDTQEEVFAESQGDNQSANPEQSSDEQTEENTGKETNSDDLTVIDADGYYPEDQGEEDIRTDDQTNKDADEYYPEDQGEEDSFDAQVQSQQEYMQTLNAVFKQINQQASENNSNIDRATSTTQAYSQPVCSAVQYYDITKKSCVNLQIYFGSLKDLFSVFYQAGQQNENDKQVAIAPYRIVSFSSTEIKIQFNFTDPLEITPADRIRITASFVSFEPGIGSNKELEQPCKRQIIPGAGAAALSAIGKASSAATTATVVGSAILQTVVSGCLAQIWGMINGMQFIMHLPAINVDFPSNAFSVIQKIMAVVTFDIPKFNMETVKKVFTLPEDDSILDNPEEVNIKTSFELLGYESIYMSNNLGSVFVIILLTSLLLFLSTILEAIRHPSVLKFNAKIKAKLQWNFVIRLVIEGYMELVFAVYFNLKYAKCSFSYLGSWVNYFYAIIFAALLGLAPLFVIGFYNLNFSKLGDEEFTDKFGSVYDGLKTNSRSVIAFTTIFLVRRVLFALLTVMLYKHVIIQLILTVVLIMASACYIVHFKPFEEPLINRLEVMNEVTTLLLVNLIFMFTPIIDSPKVQYNLGFVFVCIMALCISVHLFFIFKDIILSSIRVFKRWRNKRALLLKQQQGEAVGFFEKIQLFLGLKNPKVIPIEDNKPDQELPNFDEHAQQQNEVSEPSSVEEAEEAKAVKQPEEPEELEESKSVTEFQNDQSVLESIESSCSGPIKNSWHQRKDPLTFPIEKLFDKPPIEQNSNNYRNNTRLRSVAHDATRNTGLRHVRISVVDYNNDDSFHNRQDQTNVSRWQESYESLDFQLAYEELKQEQGSRKRFNSGTVGIDLPQIATVDEENLEKVNY